MAKQLFTFFLVLVMGMSSCRKDDELSEIREIAWNSLTEEQRTSVIINWQEASVEIADYQEREAYAVTFNTTDEEVVIVGPIIVYVATDTREVLGQGLRW